MWSRYFEVLTLLGETIILFSSQKWKLIPQGTDLLLDLGPSIVEKGKK